jgi:hypothetical protein
MVRVPGCAIWSPRDQRVRREALQLLVHTLREAKQSCGIVSVIAKLPIRNAENDWCVDAQSLCGATRLFRSNTSQLRATGDCRMCPALSAVGDNDHIHL